MKKAFTLVEVTIVVTLIGLLAAVAIPAFMESKNKREIKINLSPAQLNDAAIKKANFQKVAEFHGYDIYTFTIYGETYSVIIPTTNSVYASVPLEKLEN